MGSLSLQDTGLECTLHGINLFTLYVSNLHVVPRAKQLVCSTDGRGRGL